MQPLHGREARWFFEWDRLELVRGTGLSLVILGALFFLLNALGHLPLANPFSAGMAWAGLLLFLLTLCIDNLGRPYGKRKIRWRGCRKSVSLAAVIESNWKCARCGGIGRFDNLR